MLSLLLLACAVQDPSVALSAGLLPGKGSVAFHGTAVVTFESAGDVPEAWVKASSWAIRDSAGATHPLAAPSGATDAAARTGSEPERLTLDLASALAECALGKAQLLFHPDPDTEPRVLKTMTIGQEIDSSTMDLSNAQSVPDEKLAQVRVQIEAEVNGKDVGTMTLEFWPQAAPVTVRNFARYAAEGFYDGLTFHRVIPGFMIQGGCPKGNGTGNGSHGTIRGEFSQDKAHSHQKGVISMARTNSPDSASCQFFICHGDAGFLDGQYAAFGKLTEGTSTLDAIAAVPCKKGGEGSTPAQPCKIRKMRVFMVD